MRVSWVGTCRNELLELLRSLTQSAACCALGIICIARNNCSLFVATRHVRNSAFRNFVCSAVSLRSWVVTWLVWRMSKTQARLRLLVLLFLTHSFQRTLIDRSCPTRRDRLGVLQRIKTALRVRLRSSLNLENTSPHPSTSRRFGCYQILWHHFVGVKWTLRVRRAQALDVMLAQTCSLGATLVSWDLRFARPRLQNPIFQF